MAAPAAARASALCPPPPVTVGAAPRLQQIDGATRLAWIDTHLADTAHHAKLWKWGWGIGIAVATVANLAPLPFVSPDERIDWYTGAASTVVGIVPLVIAPLAVIDDSAALRARLALPAGDRDLCRDVAFAEGLLIRDAENQADGQRWWLHGANVVVNAAVGLFLGLGFHHWKAGAFNFATGAVIGEAIILTQPTGSIDDLARYRDGALDH